MKLYTEQAAQWLRAHEEETKDLLRQLCRIPAPSHKEEKRAAKEAKRKAKLAERNRRRAAKGLPPIEEKPDAFDAMEGAGEQVTLDETSGEAKSTDEPEKVSEDNDSEDQKE